MRHKKKKEKSQWYGSSTARIKSLLKGVVLPKRKDMKWQRREAKDPSSICLEGESFSKHRPSNYSLPSNETNTNANDILANNNNAHLVYVRDVHYKWLPARVLSTDGRSAKVVLSIPNDWNQTTVTTKELNLVEERTVHLSDYPNGALPLQNVDYKGELLAKWDMDDLRYLHDAAILFNIKKKHSQGIPYTRIGKGGVTVALNPFQWMGHLYSDEKQRFYAEQIIWNGNTKSMHDCYNLSFDPHLYEASSFAYRGLAMDGPNQTLFVSGESGAGKSESVKLLTSHLARIQFTRPNAKGLMDKIRSAQGTPDISRKFIESNIVLESFGNAKVLRNSNSSRYSKLIQLYYDVEELDSTKKAQGEVPQCLLVGSSYTVYLLEKNRVANRSEGERAFHIFYQLLAAPDQFKADVWDGLQGATKDHFKYTSSCDSSTLELLEKDAAGWSHTQKAMRAIGLEGEELKSILQSLCIILVLGNITFEEKYTGDINSTGSFISSRDDLHKLSLLMGIDSETLEVAMTSKVIRTSNDACRITLCPSSAKEGCDAFAKEIYGSIFDSLTQRINGHMSTKSGKEQPEGIGLYNARVCSRKFKHINIVELFGMESFNTNNFEQLCINYLNECLSVKYVLGTFSFPSGDTPEDTLTSDLCDIEKFSILKDPESRVGLNLQLSEESTLPSRVKMANGNLHKSSEFGINHFIDPVSYEAETFLESHGDKLSKDQIGCARLSTNTFIRGHFQTLFASLDANNDVKHKNQNEKVLNELRSQLRNLMVLIDETQTRYVRCIKPNESTSPRLIDHDMTMRQLESCRLVTAISRKSFSKAKVRNMMLPKHSTKSGKDLISRELLIPEDFLTTFKEAVDKFTDQAFQAVNKMSATNCPWGTQRSHLIGISSICYAAPAVVDLANGNPRFILWLLQVVACFWSDYIDSGRFGYSHFYDKVLASTLTLYIIHFGVMSRGILFVMALGVPTFGCFGLSSAARKANNFNRYIFFHCLWHVFGGIASVLALSETR